MKILHINCNYMGKNNVHRTMIEHLSKRGFDNYVFVPTYKKNLISNNKNVIVSKCFNKYDRLVFDLKSLKIKNALIKSFDMQEIDIIHAYTLFTDGNVAYNIKRKYGIPYVVAVRNTDVNTFFRKMPFLRKRGIKIMLNADAVFFLSDSYKNQVLEKYVPLEYRERIENKIHIIPNGIDSFWLENPVRKKSKTKNNVINIIYAGRIDENKNIETTQKALELLRSKGYIVNFTIVGVVENKKVFSSIMKYPNTKYYDYKPKEELMDLYRKNDVFVMPSFYETFGLVYVEAMSQGLPVIYTQKQGFDGFFDNGLVGYAVNPNDANEIAKRIMDILNKYDEISKNCIIQYSKFDWNTIINRYIEIYKRTDQRNGSK